MRTARVVTLGLLASVWLGGGSASAADLKLLLPLGRTACQTNERIDVSVVRSAAEALAAGDLALVLTGEDGSRLAFTFRVPAVAVADGKAVRTEHLVLDGRLLRPGRYTLQVSADGAAAKVDLDVFSHVRPSTFHTIYWAQGDTAGPAQETMGPDGLGFNLFWGQGRSWSEHLIRGGLDYMQCCTMGGGHQMDLRQECDWSDPYVLGGGVARAARQALVDRTRPNVTGVHLYDEPGLTWWKHPRTGEMVPHNLPSQDRAFRSAFGREAPQYDAINPQDPVSLAAWMDLGRWKQGFMEAAWTLSRFAVEQVRPDYITCTQSVYAWYAFSDGYYFNIHRSLPVICGHGGYDLWGPGFYHPSVTLAMGRARQWDKPCWYLPTWDNETADRFRLQQYLSFMQGIQGLMTPPPIKVMRPWEEPVTEGVVESNLLMSRLGPIFEHGPPTRPTTAVLYSLSANLYDQARHMKEPHDAAGPYNYGHRQKGQMDALYAAHGMTQYEFFPVVEEDVLDGTLAVHHRTLIVPTVHYLPPGVVAALEAFIAGGGKVFVSDDATVAIPGAEKFGMAVPAPQAEPSKMVEFLQACRPLAETLKARYKECDLAPVFECDTPGIFAARHILGDVEYLFAVNAACDEKRGGYNPVRPAVATIRLPNDSRPVYDAVRGGVADDFVGDGNALIGRFRFGAGQMRVWARTPNYLMSGERPCGLHLTPVEIRRDFTSDTFPMTVEACAVVTDSRSAPVRGAVPVEILLMDPLGRVRYRLSRATADGVLHLPLPLAANDVAGEWMLAVSEPLAGTGDSACFTLGPLKACGAAAGAVRRAVSFGRDPQNVFRFFRLHKDVTIVTGKADFHAAAAERLAKGLAPWGVRARIVPADDVNKPRQVPEDGQKTWVGVDFGRLDPAKPALGHTGFALDGPAVLLGTPEDNPLIKFLAEKGYLPYQPVKDEFPGRGRGLMAWQRDGIGWFGQESVTLIAYDAEGMAEAVAALYEAAAGLEPLMKWEPPSLASVTPVVVDIGGQRRVGPRPLPPAAAAAWAKAHGPGPREAWRLRLPDRAAAIRTLPGDRVVILTKDGTLAVLDAGGKEAWRQEIDDGGEDWALAVAADGKSVTVDATHRRIAYDAATGKVLKEEPLTPATDWQRPKPPTFPVSLPKRTVIALAPDGEGAVVAVAEEGAVVRLKSRAGKVEDHVAWEYKEPGRIAKKLAAAGGLVAVAYWGGDLRILDAQGKVVCGTRMSQDIADMAWVGGRLVVGCANGQVMGLDARWVGLPPRTDRTNSQGG